MASQAQDSVIWQGHASAHGTFENVIHYSIKSGYIKDPGPYCIVRLDRTIDKGNRPVIAYTCMVQDDMQTVTTGIKIPMTVQQKKLVTWPPK